MIVNTGNHNHHNRSDTIQLMTNGRFTTYNRQHIKPTTVTAEAHLQHQSNKNYNIKTDPLMEILNNINKNPAVYAYRQATNTNNKEEQSNEQIYNTCLQQEARDIGQCNTREYISHKEETGVPQDNRYASQGSEVKRTRLGCIVKEPERLTYV